MAISVLLHRILIVLSSFYFAHSYVHGVVGLRIKHRPIVNQTRTLIRDQQRVQSIHTPSRAHLDAAKNDDKVDLSNALGSAIYSVDATIGTPPQEIKLNLDTGSSITWIQCQQCRDHQRCYQQSEPIFDPSSSSTYSNNSCSKTGPYKSHYKDESFSEGVYGCDTLSISTDSYPKFTFGCGDNNYDKYNFDKASGMLALGRDGVAAKTFGDVFCYCLPTLNHDDGFIYFQEEAKQKCKPKKFIKLLDKADDDLGHYYVNLVGITIGKSKLKMGSQKGSPPSTILDSGTIFTRLPQAVYDVVSSEFQKVMAKYPPAQNEVFLELCYDLARFSYQSLQIPTMILHFEPKSEIVLGKSAVITKIVNSSVYCLAFAPNDGDETIIGSHQHKSMNVLYDTPAGRIGFGKGDCGEKI